MGLLMKIASRFVRGRWGAILPALFRGAADGQFGPQVRAVYWWLAGKKTIAGAILLGTGAALETVCAGYATFAWACQWSGYVYAAGAFLAAVGLVDGGTRAPWPSPPQGVEKE